MNFSRQGSKDFLHVSFRLETSGGSGVLVIFLPKSGAGGGESAGLVTF